MVLPTRDLSILLKTMEPVLNSGTFVYASIREYESIDPALVVASIREPEGLSVVMKEADALHFNLPTLFRCSWITLTVNSDLHAVGLTAVFATALASAGISCNIVAGAFHDHIFVPVHSAERAMEELRSLQARMNADPEGVNGSDLLFD